jgi:PIN domain nuclease of toxin-antitoxin system
VTLLLDSHAFPWFVWDDPILSPSAKALIEDPGNFDSTDHGPEAIREADRP